MAEELHRSVEGLRTELGTREVELRNGERVRLELPQGRLTAENLQTIINAIRSTPQNPTYEKISTLSQSRYSQMRLQLENLPRTEQNDTQRRILAYLTTYFEYIPSMVRHQFLTLQAYASQKNEFKQKYGIDLSNDVELKDLEAKASMHTETLAAKLHQRVHITNYLMLVKMKQENAGSWTGEQEQAMSAAAGLLPRIVSRDFDPPEGEETRQIQRGQVIDLQRVELNRLMQAALLLDHDIERLMQSKEGVPGVTEAGVLPSDYLYIKFIEYVQRELIRMINRLDPKDEKNRKRLQGYRDEILRASFIGGAGSGFFNRLGSETIGYMQTLTIHETFAHTFEREQVDRAPEALRDDPVRLRAFLDAEAKGREDNLRSHFETVIGPRGILRERPWDIGIKLEHAWDQGGRQNMLKFLEALSYLHYLPKRFVSGRWANYSQKEEMGDVREAFGLPRDYNLLTDQPPLTPEQRKQFEKKMESTRQAMQKFAPQIEEKASVFLRDLDLLKQLKSMRDPDSLMGVTPDPTLRNSNEPLDLSKLDTPEKQAAAYFRIFDQMQTQWEGYMDTALQFNLELSGIIATHEDIQKAAEGYKTPLFWIAGALGASYLLGGRGGLARLSSTGRIGVLKPIRRIINGPISLADRLTVGGITEAVHGFRQGEGFLNTVWETTKGYGRGLWNPNPTKVDMLRREVVELREEAVTSAAENAAKTARIAQLEQQLLVEQMKVELHGIAAEYEGIRSATNIEPAIREARLTALEQRAISFQQQLARVGTEEYVQLARTLFPSLTDVQLELMQAAHLHGGSLPVGGRWPEGVLKQKMRILQGLDSIEERAFTLRNGTQVVERAGLNADDAARVLRTGMGGERAAAAAGSEVASAALNAEGRAALAAEGSGRVLRRVGAGAIVVFEAYNVYAQTQELIRQKERITQLKITLKQNLETAGFRNDPAGSDRYVHDCGAIISINEFEKNVNTQVTAQQLRLGTAGAELLATGAGLYYMGTSFLFGPVGLVMAGIAIAVEAGITAWKNQKAREFIASPSTSPWMLAVLGTQKLVERSEYEMLVDSSSWTRHGVGQDLMFSAATPVGAQPSPSLLEERRRVEESREALKQEVRSRMMFTIFSHELGSVSRELLGEILAVDGEVAGLNNLYAREFQSIVLPFAYVRLHQLTRQRGGSAAWDTIKTGRVDSGYVFVPPEVHYVDIRMAMREAGVMFVQHVREQRYIGLLQAREALKQRAATAAEHQELETLNRVIETESRRSVLGQPLASLTLEHVRANGGKTRAQILMENIYRQVDSNGQSPSFSLSADAVRDAQGLPEQARNSGVDFGSTNAVLAYADNEAQRHNLAVIGPLTLDEPEGRVAPAWNDWGGQLERLITPPQDYLDTKEMNVAHYVHAASNIARELGRPELQRGQASEDAARAAILDGSVELFQRRAQRKFSRDGLLGRNVFDTDAVPVFSHLERSRWVNNTPTMEKLCRMASFLPSDGPFSRANLKAVFFEGQELDKSGHNAALVTFVFGNVEDEGLQDRKVYVLQRAAATFATGPRITGSLVGNVKAYTEQDFLSQNGAPQMMETVRTELRRRRLERAQTEDRQRIERQRQEEEAQRTREMERPRREAEQRTREEGYRQHAASLEALRSSLNLDRLVQTNPGVYRMLRKGTDGVERIVTIRDKVLPSQRPAIERVRIDGPIMTAPGVPVEREFVRKNDVAKQTAAAPFEYWEEGGNKQTTHGIYGIVDSTGGILRQQHGFEFEEETEAHRSLSLDILLTPIEGQDELSVRRGLAIAPQYETEAVKTLLIKKVLEVYTKIPSFDKKQQFLRDLYEMPLTRMLRESSLRQLRVERRADVAVTPMLPRLEQGGTVIPDAICNAVAAWCHQNKARYGA